MEILHVENLSFSYPKSREKALDTVSFSLRRGEFALLCGESGSGKTTLLRMLKPELLPCGEKSGEILFEQKPLEQLEKRESAEKIGFVQQDPDSQIVTDKVWHELAFAMENLGYSQTAIRLRVGEMASYFGLEPLFHRDTHRLSGGQKQLLNLASVLTLRPELLILDEPTGQLDPLAASEFLNILQKINRDFGITILLSEHNLEEALPMARRILVMEQGKMTVQCGPREVSKELLRQDPAHKMLSALPAPVRVYHGLQAEGECPLTINEGRNFLFENYKNHIKQLKKSEIIPKGEPEFTLENVWFRYDKRTRDVLRGLNLTVYRGEIFAMLGANGSGKSTAAKLICRMLKAYRGKLKRSSGRQAAYLPQNPQTLFLKDTVLEDLLLNGDRAGAEAAAKRLGIAPLLSRHPFDLSGGEIQKAALAKLLLCAPDFLVLDEPTKGVDSFAKQDLVFLLRDLQKQGKTIFIVTHDIEFASLVSQRCGLLFDGRLLAQSAPSAFFAGNSFYTTAANKMSRGFFNQAVTCGDVIELCRENGEKHV